MLDIIDKDEIKKKEIKKRISDNRKCSKCGSDKTSNNWYKYRDEKGIWDRSSLKMNIAETDR